MRHGPWMGYGPREAAWSCRCPCCGREFTQPSREEKIGRLEAHKKRLEEKLSRINEALEQLKKEEKPST